MTEDKKNNIPEGANKEVVEEKIESKNQQQSTREDHNQEVEVLKQKEKSEKEEKKKSKKEKKEGKIKELESKFLELSDKHLRLQAEFDNFRRRTMKEKAELIKSGGESVIMGILPVIDDFERAIDSMEEIPDEDSGKQGTLLIYSKFKDFLKQNNVKEIEALHKDFDVDHHEAITKIPVDDEKLKGKVVEVIQKGYTLNDKVIRFAKVVVGE